MDLIVDDIVELLSILLGVIKVLWFCKSIVQFLEISAEAFRSELSQYFPFTLE